MSQLRGADVATPVSVAQCKSFVDVACPSTIANAIAAGIADIDVYHYPYASSDEGDGHYSNARGHVERQGPAGFEQHDAGAGFALFYGESPRLRRRC